MAERTRRYAKKPKTFAVVVLIVAAISAASAVGLAERARAPLYSVESSHTAQSRI